MLNSLNEEHIGMRLFLLAALSVCGLFGQSPRFDYRILATNKTSTLEKEMNESAEAGFAFVDAMGGQSAFGGKEGVVLMAKGLGADGARMSYKLLATSKTSTMQKELQQLGAEGFEYKAQTVYESTFGGQEVVVIMERNKERAAAKIEYKLLATNKTSTMQKELKQAGDEGYRAVGITVAKSAFGGSEVITILRKD